MGIYEGKKEMVVTAVRYNNLTSRSIHSIDTEFSNIIIYIYPILMHS